MTLNGTRKPQALAWDELTADSRIEIRQGALLSGQQAIHRVSADPYSESRAVFGPRGVVQLPHARIEKTDTPLVYSTPLTVNMRAGDYKLELTDFYNMGYLQSNSTFSAAGDADGASNRFDIYGICLLRVK